MKEKWIFDYTKRPDVDVLEQTQSDLTDALDMIKEIVEKLDPEDYPFTVRDANKFLTKFRKQ